MRTLCLRLVDDLDAFYANCKSGDTFISNADGDCTATYGAFSCTRVFGHPDQHVAETGGMIAEVWA